jgi:hypothetical protein
MVEAELILAQSFPPKLRHLMELPVMLPLLTFLSTCSKAEAELLAQ